MSAFVPSESNCHAGTRNPFGEGLHGVQIGGGLHALDARDRAFRDAATARRERCLR